MGRRNWTWAGLLAAAVAGGAVVTIAGPLNPPAGPVASTYKTLAEVEPRIVVNATNTPASATGVFRISQPGSYYLAADVIGVAARNGIEIASNDVTLDLRGFNVRGVVGSSLHGIVAIGVRTGVVVKNGTIRGWGQTGLNFNVAGNAIDAYTIEGVTSCGNSLEGFFVRGRGVITNCVAAANVREGFIVSDGVVVRGCAASANGLAGFIATTGCVFENCTSRQNGSGGFALAGGATGLLVYSACSATGNTGDGFVTFENALLTNCSASGNTGRGIACGVRSLVRGCTASQNGQDNIVVSGFSSVIECVANNSTSGSGISTSGSQCIIRACVANGNAQDGIRGSDRANVIDCVASLNGQNGIRANFVGSVRGCFAEANSNCGIFCEAGGLTDVIGNSCSGNGVGAGVNGAGIRIGVNGCRVEQNQCSQNYRGLDVAGSRNIIVSNRCVNNSNSDFTIASMNTFGPIITAQGVGDLAGVAGANHPQANFRY